MIDVIQAHDLELHACDVDCECQSVHLLLLDADGNPFAAASLSASRARQLATAITQQADLAEARLARNKGRVM